jgi:antibiotic biosynthesis monooxygenase (ABM) superfamily enzyme
MAQPAAHPVTALITRRVRRGCESRFEQLMAGLQAEAAAFEGHLGGYLIKPESGGRYQVLFAFESDAQLAAWMGSAERRAWLERLATVSRDEGSMRVLSGLESWFALPGARTQRPPPRYKMALVTWLGIFPLVLLLSNLIGPWLAPIHPALSVLVVTALVVVAMTWFVAPALTRLLASWLYPSEPRADSTAPKIPEHP